jgi:hypothetical protein
VGLRCRVENGRTESYSSLRSVQESSFAGVRLKSTPTTDHVSALHRVCRITRSTRLMRSQGCHMMASVSFIGRRRNGKDDSRGDCAGWLGPVLRFLLSPRDAPCYLPSACTQALWVDALGPETLVNLALSPSRPIY